ncbi:AAA family ATPase [Holophaga foetida]|uniref:AAA family ATPase n=1 Tax=Holophaga foetida TaxID=35839 RepID=UPI0002472A4A|nr:ATP-binding protein [Holophaga foetida]
MARVSRRPFQGLPVGFDQVTTLMLLRLLVDLDGIRVAVDARGFPDRWIVRLMGLETEGAPPLARSPGFLRFLNRRLKTLNILAPKLPGAEPLTCNLEWLVKTLALNPVERDILIFLGLAHHSTLLGTLLDKFGPLRTHEVHALIAAATRRPVEEITSALLHTAKLIHSGLVWSELRNKWGFDSKIGLLQGLPDQLTLHHDDPSEVFLSNFLRSHPAKLKINAYPHLRENLQILIPYMEEVLRTGRKGVNILLHGQPGTGKTELARAVAAELKASLFEVASEDRYGEAHRPEARFGAYQLAQGVLGGDPKPLVLFDEIEDVFRPADDDIRRGSNANGGGKKAWVNRLLEENPTPTFWVTNSLSVIDLAFLRRFDMVIEVGVPPRSVRETILQNHTADLAVSPAWLRRMSDHQALTPAGIERAAKVAHVVTKTPEGPNAEAVMECLVGNTLEAMGVPRRSRASVDSPTQYRLELLNADRDLEVICRGVKESGAARLCLFGPPGTGKTAFGHHLARVTDRPLHLHRASDLLGAYVGQTEAAMARMFRQAENEGAVLLLDEADSFLRNRSLASQGWEVSQVNEMLTQLETYKGVFVASTNLMDNQDPAALRRFDAKIRFDFLEPTQRVAMFMDACEGLGITPTSKNLESVSRMPRLTPGDFAVVLRQGRFDPITTGADLVGRLTEECRLKGGIPRRSIGF